MTLENLLGIKTSLIWIVFEYRKYNFTFWAAEWGGLSDSVCGAFWFCFLICIAFGFAFFVVFFFLEWRALLQLQAGFVSENGLRKAGIAGMLNSGNQKRLLEEN